jgi:lipid A 3-O-deacylase
VETRKDFSLGERWTFTLSSGPGYFRPGGGLDLGHRLEFLTAGELSYRLDGGGRIGLVGAHLSNAGISRRNPGVETIALAYSVPL